MSNFVYQDPFPLGPDNTQYRRLEGSEKYVSVEQFAGSEVLKVAPEALTVLAAAAMREKYGAKIVLLPHEPVEASSAMIRELLPVAKRFITVQPDSPRAMTAEDLAEEIRSLGGEAEPAGMVENGVKTLLTEAKPDDVLLAIGSLYMSGAVRAAMGK